MISKNSLLLENKDGGTSPLNNFTKANNRLGQKLKPKVEITAHKNIVIRPNKLKLNEKDDGSVDRNQHQLANNK